LEQPSPQHRHDSAAAGRAAWIGALPRRSLEASRRRSVKGGRRIVFECLESGANLLAQGFEPALRARLAGFELSFHRLDSILRAQVRTSAVLSGRPVRKSAELAERLAQDH